MQESSTTGKAMAVFFYEILEIYIFYYFFLLKYSPPGEFYSPHGIQYLGLQLLDQPSANISQHFEECAAFIEECLKGGGGFYLQSGTREARASITCP